MTTTGGSDEGVIVLEASETLRDGRNVKFEIVLHPGAGSAPATWPRSPEDLSRELKRIALDLVQPLTGEVLADRPDALEREFIERYRRAAELLLKDAGRSLDSLEVEIDPGAADPLLAVNRKRLADSDLAADDMDAAVRVHAQYSLDFGAT